LSTDPSKIIEEIISAKEDRLQLTFIGFVPDYEIGPCVDITRPALLGESAAVPSQV
jgi:hypothetical protein